MTSKTEGRDEAGLFAPGNRIWESRPRAGPKPIFATGDDLWAACVEYFEWVAENPLIEFVPRGMDGKLVEVPKMRAMTVGALCVFLGVSESSWHSWRTNDVLKETVERVNAIMRAQKFEGAAAGLLQQMIIARDLGLADKSELMGDDGGPIRHVIERRIVSRNAGD